MDCVTILAQAARTAGAEGEEAIVPIDLFWEQITSLGLLEALTFISFGAVCLFYGWRIFKILVVINFGLVGLALGITVIEMIEGLDNQLVGGLIGMVILGVLSVPLMRWAVCLLGAAAGGILTSGIWYACGFTERYIWAGALIGMVGGGMMSFIIFKIAVILFTSLWGSGLVVVGSLALLYLYPETAYKVEEMVYTLRWFLPAALMVPTGVGIVLQYKFVRSSKEWDL